MRWPAATALAIIAAGVPANGAAQQQATAAQGPRRTVVLTQGWRFHRGDEDGPVAPGFDDRDWARVSLPHTWNRIGSYTTTRDPHTDAYQGVGWYRLHFIAPDRRPGDRSFLQFDGVGSIAEVWLNGRRLGEHRGAFSRFRFDVTDALAPGENVLVVRTDNSERKAGSSTADVIPLSGDFFIYGGIYRGVSLITTAATHIDMTDHGGPGVYATTRALSDARAAIDVRTRVVTGRAADLSVSLVDAGGRTVARATRRIEAGEAVLTLDVPRPHRWNGRADPYLYSLVAELAEGGRVVDRLVQPFGIRDFRFDANRGFFLNGRHLALHGVSRHQDRAGKGWALSAADHEEDMAMVEALGANTIRMAHYQHAPEWFDLADRAGMVVWAEVPFVNQVAWTDTDANARLTANAEQQLTELIRQNYNRPGIVTWSIGNEVDIHARGEHWGNHSRALLDRLNALAHREDPSRPTTFADCCEASLEPEEKGREVLAGAADLIGYNRYVGWYYGKPDDLGATLDILHGRHPAIPLSVSEYGAGGAISQHSDDPRGGPVAVKGRPQPEEYQSYILERAWPAIAARPYVWASWVWNMFDFVSNVRSEGDATDLNTKGLVTFDRRVKKDAFYYLQAQWSGAPVLHLTGRRYVDRAYPVVDVRAYSNAPRARLSVNGRDAGWTACPGRICIWPGVRLTAGVNTLTAGDARGRRDSIAWRATDPHAGLAIDAGALVGGVHEGRRYGSDAFFDGGEAVVVKDPDGIATSVRTGAFGYTLPLPDGRWMLRLTSGPAAAPFAVLADRRPLATMRPRQTLRVPVTVTGGRLRLAFSSGASIAAIVVEPEK